MLGDDTIIEVLEVRGQTVRIGIDAPRAVPVYREEIWIEVKRENQAAAEAAAASGDSAGPTLTSPAYATSLNSASSASSSTRSFLVICPWIWQTRLSVTPRISPISRRVRL